MEDQREQKEQHQRKSLDARKPRTSSGPIPGKTHLMIINGGDHEAFYGDFFALMKFFEQRTSPQFGGTYWTCDSPTAYLNLTGRADIKFGGRKIMDNEEIGYGSSSSGPPKSNWEYFGKDEICDRFMHWLAVKTSNVDENRARSGDSINIFFIAHGVATKVQDPTTGQELIVPLGVRLGDNTLKADDLVQELRKLPQDIQVNVFASSCYSGVFTNKIRRSNPSNSWVLGAAEETQRSFSTMRSVSNRWQNSAFSAGFVKSLGGFVGALNNPSVRAVQQEITAACQADDDPTRPSLPQMHSSYPDETKVMSLLLRGFADFPVQPQKTAAMRRIELEQAYLQRHNTPPFDAGPAFGQAVAVVQEQVIIFGTDDPMEFSEGWFDTAARTVSDKRSFDPTADVLLGLMWRGRQQSNVFQIFMLLVLNRHCQLSSLEMPYHAGGKISGLVAWITRTLYCFQATDQLFVVGKKVVPFTNPDFITWMTFRTPIDWLAAMIARSATDLHNVFNFIAGTRHLGDISAPYFEKLPDLPEDIVFPEPGACASDTAWTGKLGIILPSGLDLNLAENQFYPIQERFWNILRRVEDAYKNLVDPDGDVVMREPSLHLGETDGDVRRADAKRVYSYPSPPSE